MTSPPEATGGRKVPETLAERFWSIAREMDGTAPDEVDGVPDPVAIVKHVLRVLDALDKGEQGEGVTVNTLSFLVLLRQHELRGDLLYASPEQARGEQVDERGLVFSVGVLLFEKLTGRHPFGETSNPRRIARIQKGEIGSGVNYFPAVPAGLRVVLMKAMGPFPEERWESLAELRAQLEYFLQSAGVAAARPRATTPPPLKRRPPPAPATAAAATATPAAAPVTTPAQGLRSITDEEEEATKILQRQTGGVPALASLSRVATTPGATAHSAGFTLPTYEPPRPRRSFEKWMPVMYVAIGAILAAAAFMVFGRSSPPAAVATAPVAVASAPAQAAPAPSAAPAPAPAPAAAAVATLPAPAAAVPAPAAAAAAAAPTTFDPRAAAERALAEAKNCLSGEQLDAGAHFGMGVLYTRPEGIAKKLYFAAVDEIPAAARQCLNAALIGKLSAGPPPHNLIVEYRMHVRASGSDFKMGPIPE